MKRILLVDIDSKIPNLTLMKISAWHKARGDVVEFCTENPDKVYISCIFTKNAGQARGVAKLYPDAEIDIGGSGISLKKELPGEIETTKPDYDLYPSTYSQGYTTRGCIRKCGFCIVPEKEGLIREAQHPAEFHDDRFNTCMIMDNNLFAAPEDWQKSVFDWFKNTSTKMLSPQGWDARLLTPEKWGRLWGLKHAGPIHFAWDKTDDERHVIRTIDIIKASGVSKRDLQREISFYVLAGFKSEFEDALYRCNRLREMGTQAYVMPYHKKDKQINKLARWTARPHLYWSHPFTDYGKRKVVA